MPSPADTIFVLTKGRTETDPTLPQSQGGWIYFISDEYGWVSGSGYKAQGATISADGTVTGGVDDNANKNGDCDGKAAPGLGEGWAGCGMLPRYRYTRTCPSTFTDGHAKAMSKGQISYWKNIYVPGLNGLN